MDPFTIAAIAMAGGKLISKIGKDRTNKAEYENAKPQLERQSQSQAVRGALFGAIAKAYGLDKILPPDALRMLSTPAPIPSNVNESWFSTLGDSAYGIGKSYMDSQKGQEPQDYKGLYDAYMNDQRMQSNEANASGPSWTRPYSAPSSFPGQINPQPMYPIQPYSMPLGQSPLNPYFGLPPLFPNRP